MKCGPYFPFPKPRPEVSDGSKKDCPVTFFNIVDTPEIFEIILSHLCYTDRASLSQSCAEATIGISSSQTVWFVNLQMFGDAELRDEEFEHIIEAGEVWDVSVVRGAKVSLPLFKLKRPRSIPDALEVV